MSTGAWVVVAAVVLALGFGTYRRLTDGRFAATSSAEVREAPTTSLETTAAQAPDAAPADSLDNLLADTPWHDALGERATLLQFSSAFCAPCRATRRVLADVSSTTPGVRHVEVDAEQHLDVVRRLGVAKTPTTIVLDAQGRERGRATGAPSREQVTRVLDGVPGA